MFRRSGFIALLAIIVLIILTATSKATAPECTATLKANVKMYLNMKHGNELPRWFEPWAGLYEVEITGKKQWGENYYLVSNALYTFWTNESSIESMTPCNDYAVTEFTNIAGVGCANPYHHEAGHRYEILPQDGRPMGYEGTGMNLMGWAYLTLQNGEWRVTPSLPKNEGETIKVYHSSLREECLSQLPK